MKSNSPDPATLRFQADTLRNHRFGSAVDLDGDRAIVGARNAYQRGAAYVFLRSGTTWTQEKHLIEEMHALPSHYPDQCIVHDDLWSDGSEPANGITRDRKTDTPCITISFGNYLRSASNQRSGDYDLANLLKARKINPPARMSPLRC